MVTPRGCSRRKSGIIPYLKKIFPEESFNDNLVGKIKAWIFFPGINILFPFYIFLLFSLRKKNIVKLIIVKNEKKKLFLKKKIDFFLFSSIYFLLVKKCVVLIG